MSVMNTRGLHPPDHRPPDHRLTRRQALRQAGVALAVGSTTGLMGASARAMSSQSTSEPVITTGSVDAALPLLEALAQQSVETGAVPGLSIAVVYRDEVVYLGGFGLCEVGQPAPVDADTVFQLASMSKPIAATVVAAIIGAGAATWDDRLIEHDPGFQLSDPWVTREVTIRDCFCHRTGLPGGAGNDLEDIGYDRDEILARLRYLPLASSFRSQYAYSNFGLTAGAIAAARATGMVWEEICPQRLYRPLGMSATSSRYADYAAAQNRALLHTGGAGRWAQRFTRQPDAQSPAGGVSSTARDLAQWVRLMLGNGMVDGIPLIVPEALAQTHLPHIVRGPNPETGSPGFYGLGWNVDIDSHGRPVWSHAGAFSLGARTYVRLLPAEQLGIVVLANAFPTGVPDGLAASFVELVVNGRLSRDWVAFWNERYDDLIEAFSAAGAVYATPPAAPAPPLSASAYVGTYANDYVGALEISGDDVELLMRIGPGQMTFPLRHRDRDLFLYEPAPELPGVMSGVTFVIGPDQTAWQVVVDGYEEVGRGTFARAPAAG